MLTTTAIESKKYTKADLCIMETVAEPCGIIIFGASGDLTHHKLIPSIFKLAEDGVFPKDYYIIGVGRTDFSDATFQDSILADIPNSSNVKTLSLFLERCGYLPGDYSDSNLYKTLQQRMTVMDKIHHVNNRHIFYCSTPPQLYEIITNQLGASGLAASEGNEGWNRIVLEKPFGQDLQSAEKLNQTISRVFKENQIYRIDHYLGKETVQNILMFRFANTIYEPVWNRKYIDHIQITAAETIGVGQRADYYEQFGVVRDMFQNHLFQLLSLVAMELPNSFNPDAMRDEKTKVLAALHPIGSPDYSKMSVRGQYTAGTQNGDNFPAYRAEVGVNPASTTETFAAMRVEVDNDRWQGVPFYLRSGKRLAERVTEIVIHFKQVPTSIFKPLMADQISPNIIRLRIQPNEGISICFEAKHPGPKICVSTVTMEFNYQESFGTPPPEDYSRLFLDVMLGDQTLFARNDWVIHSWKFLSPLLDFWSKEKENGLYFYPAGSWGPAEANRLYKAQTFQTNQCP